MAYNMSNFTNASNTYQLFEAVNTTTNYVLGYMSLLVLWFIVFMLLKRNNETAESMTASSAVALVYCLILLSLGAIPTYWVIIVTLVWGASAAALYMWNKVR